MAFVGPDCRPAFGIEMAIQPGQDDRAGRQGRDSRQQIGGRRNAAGRTRGDHRVARRCLFPIAPQPLKQQVAPRRRIDFAVLGQNRRPVLGHDLQEVESLLPVRRQFGGRQIRQAVEGQPLGLGLVEQSRQRLSEQDRLFHRGVLRALHDQPRQHKLPFHIGNRRRRIEQRRALRRQILAGRKGEFVLVDIADRAHARQQQGGAAAQPEERLAQGAAGAAGRQQNQDRREPLRRTAEPVEQAAGQGGDEIPMGRNGVDAGSGPAASRFRSPAGSGRGAVSRH